MATTKNGDELYYLEHDCTESVRLTTQYFTFEKTVGFQLHPLLANFLNTTTANEGGHAVLEIGCANCIWLLDMASKYPNVQFTGLDMSDSLFPSTSHLPPNLKLHNHNALEPIPHDLQGTFSVVHVRALSLGLPEGHPRPFTERALEALRPGGWLQWDEPVAQELDVLPFCDPSGPYPELQYNCDSLRAVGLSRGITLQWVRHLPEILEEEGFEAVQGEAFDVKPEMCRLWTDNLVMAMEPILLKAALLQPEKFQGEQTVRGRMRRTLEEVKAGGRVGLPIVWALGRKSSDA